MSGQGGLPASNLLSAVGILVHTSTGRSDQSRGSCVNMERATLATGRRTLAYDPDILLKTRRPQVAGWATLSRPLARFARVGDKSVVLPTMNPKVQQIRFCTSRDGTRIAYATCG